MARALLIPFAEHRLDGADNGSCVPTVCSFHTSVTSTPAPAATVSVEWNGHAVQHRRANAASAANLNGNYRVAAFEFMDKGTGFPAHDDASNTSPPMTAAQCETGAQLVAWYYQEWGVPIRFILDSRPSSTGVALHRAGVDGNFAGFEFPGRISGGEKWSAVYGKICPRDVRGRQVRDVIVPRALQLAGLSSGGTVSMPTPEVIGSAVWRTQLKDGVLASGMLTIATGNTWEILAQIKALGGTLGDDEARIIAKIMDPNNPANARTVEAVLGGVQTILEAHQDPELTVGPDETRALAAAIMEGLAPELRQSAAAGLRDVFTELAAEHAG